MIGQRDGCDALDGEHARFSAEMAIADQIESAGRVPEPVWVDLPSAHAGTRGRVIAHLYGAVLVDRLGEPINSVSMSFVGLVRAQSDCKHVLDSLHIVKRQGR